MKRRCPNCSQKYELADSQLGEDLHCGVCNGTMRFDAPLPAIVGNAEGMKFHCPHCSQKYKPHESLLGTDLKCRGCHGMMRFELPGKKVAAPAVQRGNKTLVFGLVALVLVGAVLYGSGFFRGKRSVPVANVEKSTVKKSATQEVVAAEKISVEMPEADQAAIEKMLSEPMISDPEIAKADPDELSRDSQLSTLDESKDGIFTEKVIPFLEQNCISCHGPKKEKGSLRVDFLVADLNDSYSLSHYQNIIDQLTTEDMPPEDEPRPDQQEQMVVVNVFSELVKAAKERHNSGGGRPVRRLRARNSSTRYGIRWACAPTKTGCRTICTSALSRPMRKRFS